MKLTNLVLLFTFLLEAQAFVGPFKRGGKDDAKEKDVPVPPPSKTIKYIQTQKAHEEVEIDLTAEANANLDLQSTGWVVYQGQNIIVSNYEVKSQKYLWVFDYQSCKDTNAVNKA